MQESRRWLADDTSEQHPGHGDRSGAQGNEHERKDYGASRQDKYDDAEDEEHVLELARVLHELQSGLALSQQLRGSTHIKQLDRLERVVSMRDDLLYFFLVVVDIIVDFCQCLRIVRYVFHIERYGYVDECAHIMRTEVFQRVVLF